MDETFQLPDTRAQKLKKVGKRVVKGAAVGGVVVLSAGAAMVGKPGKSETLVTSSKANSAAKTALKQSIIKNPAAGKLERMTGQISEQNKQTLKRATVRVIIGNQEGTGVLINYKGQTIVVTAAHTASDVSGNKLGLFKNINRAVDYGPAARAKNIDMYIANTSSESARMGDFQSLLVGPAKTVGDTMIGVLDPSTANLGNKVPIPSSKMINTLPAKGTKFYLYGNEYTTDKPREAYATMLGVATLHNPTIDGKYYPNLNQTYVILGGNWTSDPRNGCTARTSGMLPMQADGAGEGRLLLDQSLEVQGTGTPTGEWKDFMDQVAPNATTAQYPDLCAVATSTFQTVSHSVAGELGYMMNGRNVRP